MRLVTVGIVLTLLLGVVAFVSRGHVSPAGSGAADRGASQTLANIVFTLWILVMAAGTLVFLYILSMRRSRDPGEFRLRPLVTSLLFFAAVVIAMVLGFQRLGGKLDLKQAAGKLPKAGKLAAAGKKARAAKKLKTPHSPSFNWEFAAGILALIVGASLTAIIRSHRQRSKLIQELTVAHELSTFLDETLDDLRAEADPRRAVIAAYARMEQILSAHGLPRKASEAPVEYLQRVLLELRVTEKSVEQLTRLFERAKFSTHEIDAEMKDEAIDALVALRDDLRAIDAPSEPPTLRPEQVPGAAG